MKKQFRLAMSLALVAAILVGGAFACPVARAEEQAVQIHQHLVNRKGSPIIDAPVYPAVYTGKVFAPQYEQVTIAGNEVNLWAADSIRNAQDKIVYVENKGENAVYFRTVVAFPTPVGFDASKVLVNYSVTGYKNDNGAVPTVAGVMIDGVPYQLLIFEYDGSLEAGKTSSPSLLQIALDKSITNEDVQRLDGEYKLRIKSEAFDTVDGMYAITQTEHPWSEATK